MNNASEPTAFLNGEYLPLSRASVGVFDVGFVQGVTVAEQLRTFRGKLFRLEMHLDRLARSLEIVGLRPSQSLPELGRIATELVERNRPLIHAEDDLGATIFVTPGMSASYSDVARQSGPTVGVHTQPLSFGQWAEKYRTGDSLVVTDIVQVPNECWPRALKCRSRIHYYLADKKAQQVEPGARALLLDEDGFVMEASTANVVIYNAREGLVSPPREDVLPGVSIAVLEELATKMGISFVHRQLSVAEIAAAAEVLLCSTSPSVWSVTRLNERPIGDGQAGPICQRLRTAWSKLVGVDIEAQATRFGTR
jgi:branched-subunit amino acid aminotransferase/4-amino-4-deoxychorismate lyase